MNPAILLALILSFAHYFSELFIDFLDRFHNKLLSFSAGFFIAFIFLELFPDLIKGYEHINIFLLVLLGFTIFHLLEKYVYQHIKDKKKQLKNLKELYMAGFFIDHFIIGFVLILTLKIPGFTSLIVFIPFALHTISSSITLESLHVASKSKINKIILSSSTFIGALVALFISPFSSLYYGLFALFLGALFYVAVRDVLPKKGTGSPLYFALGVFVDFTLLFFASIL
ncbi:MAG: hypothetical protein U9Q69_04220 [Nanoarchaeota archaeon]|nr:hypothetical protein [Nanoarchaeota archaeon]